MEILFIRHAESLWNARLTEDDLDSDLSEVGKQSSLETARWLKQNFDFNNYTMLVSPYLRTLRTAQDIANECNKLPVEVDPFCREHHVGPGGPKEFIDIPIRIQEFPTFDWSRGFYEFRRKENTFVFKNRFLEQFIYETQMCINILQDCDENFVIVSHAAPIKVMYDIAIGINIDEMIREYSEDYNKMCGQIKNNSLTLVKDRKAVWLSKVVH